jgi:hypothetical protein
MAEIIEADETKDVNKNSSLEEEARKFKTLIDEANNKGYTIVHLWEYRNLQSLGHLSLTISNETYISFWPNRKISSWTVKNLIFWSNRYGMPKKSSKENQTIVEDIIDEERLPDKNFFMDSIL